MNDQVSAAETAKILSLAAQQVSEPGDWVEFGCYRGDTSVLLADLLAKSDKISKEALAKNTTTISNAKNANSSRNQNRPKRLFVYDSFAGLPEKSPEDLSAAGANFQKGALFVSRRALIDKLKRHNLNNVVIKKAWFSDLTSRDLPSQISFAFLDGDFYDSQMTALRLVAPRLSAQGVIICHDYNNPELPGATRAVDDFLKSQNLKPRAIDDFLSSQNLKPEAYPFNLRQFHTLAILSP